MKQWATGGKLRISNMFFPKRPEHLITFTGPNFSGRQIDHTPSEAPSWTQISSVTASNDIDMGSDHRALRLKMQKHHLGQLLHIFLTIVWLDVRVYSLFI